MQCFVSGERHVVVKDGVANGKCARVGPRESPAGNDRPVVRHVYDAGFIAFGCRNGHLDPLDVAELLAVAILHRVIGVQLQIEQGQPESSRYRVGPGDVLIESNGDEVARQEARAHRVDDPGYGRVNHVEAGRSVPRVVRVAEKDALAGFSKLAAQRDGVAANAAIEVVIESHVSDRFARRCCARDRGGEVAGAIANTERNEHPSQFQSVYRANPFLAGAGGRERIAVVRDVAVVARDETGAVLVHICRHGRTVLLYEFRRDHGAVESVAGEIFGGCAEVGCQRAVRCCNLACEDANTVAGGRIGKTIAEAAPVICLDVGNTVARPSNVDLVTVFGLGNGLGSGIGRAAQQQSGHEQR